MTVGEALGLATARLGESGIPEPRREARVLLRLVLGGDVQRQFDVAASLTRSEEVRLGELAERRARFEPVAYLRGWTEFRSLQFEVTPAVLIPRPETELLVEEVVTFLAGRAGRRLHVVDLGTGSGAIAVAVAAAEPRALVWAGDSSRAALAVAQRNAQRHGLGPRIRQLHGSFWDMGLPASLRGCVDVAVSNPPYVTPAEYAFLPPEVKEWEPREAVMTLPDFRANYATVARGGLEWLAPHGLLAFEVGLGQAGAVADLVASLGFDHVRVHPDYAGIPRMVLAHRPSS